MASFVFPDTGPANACMADHVDVASFGAGDRFAIVVYTDTGTFNATITYPAYDSFSAGLGYTLL